MIDLNTLLGIFTQLRQWLEFTKASGKETDKDYQEALTALYNALNETRIYLGSLERNSLSAKSDLLQIPSARNIDTEARLSKLWTAAAIKLRQYDLNLADRVFIKGDYWANPDRWINEEIKEANIQIEELFQDARKLLQE